MFQDNDKNQEYDHEVLEISRVVRVVKGGRRFRFRAAVVAGDRSGKVGIGTAKSKDIQHAIQKATDQAIKTAKKLKIDDGTIAHTVVARYKGAIIKLRPARPGTGIIAGGVVRTVVDLAGMQNLVAKRYGSSNKISNARATLAAMDKLLK